MTMKNKRVISFLTAVLIMLTMFSGNMVEAAEQTDSFTAYPVDVDYKEYVMLTISEELPQMDIPSETDSVLVQPTVPVQTEPPNEEATRSLQTEPPENVDVSPELPGVKQYTASDGTKIGAETEEDTPETDANFVVFRCRKTDMESGNVYYRIQVQKQEAERWPIFFGTLYPGEKVLWDEETEGDILIRTRLSEALLGDQEWLSCIDNGVYAYSQNLSQCILRGQTVIYTDDAFTLFQMQSYGIDGNLYSVEMLSQGSTQQLVNGIMMPITWSDDLCPVMQLTKEEVPLQAEAEQQSIQMQLAAAAEQNESLTQQLGGAEQTIRLLYIAISVLAILHLVWLILWVVSKKRHTSRRKNKAKTEQVKPAVGNVRNVGTVHNIGGRSGQQDSFDVINCSAGTLAVVADGMGGLADGDKVSQKIVATMRADSARIRPGKTDSVLCQMVAHANQEVNRMLGTSRQYKCGSTLLAVLVENGTIQWITVGDSRIYLYRGGKLIQINREHIYCAELLEHAINGKISFAEALRDPQVDRLSSFVGMGELKHVDICLNRMKLCPGDHILLMSDGVFNTLSEDEIAETIKTSANASNAASVLEEKVLKKNAPNQDNFTCVILEV